MVACFQFSISEIFSGGGREGGRERGEDPMAVTVAAEAASQYYCLSRVTMVAGYSYTSSDGRHGKSKIRGNSRNNKA